MLGLEVILSVLKERTTEDPKVWIFTKSENKQIVEMTLKEMCKQKHSFRNTSWHKAHSTSIYMEIRDTSSEITWFADSSNIFPRSEM